MINLKSVTPIGAFAFGFDVPKLRLDYKGLVIVTGQNGVGKSSIMNSIAQALTMHNDTTGEGDEISNCILKEGCNIQEEFEADDGNFYRIEYCRRFKRPGSNARVTDLFFFRIDNGVEVDLRGESVSHTTKIIQQITGLDFDRFRATSYLGVQNAPLFLNGTDADRMGVITPFLGLETFDQAQQKTRTLKKNSLDFLASKKGRFDHISETSKELCEQILSDEHTASLNSAIETNKGNIQGYRSEIDRIKASTTSVDNRRRVLESDLVRSNQTLKNLQAQQKSLELKYQKDLSDCDRMTPELDRSNLDNLNARKWPMSHSWANIESTYNQKVKEWRTTFGIDAVLRLDSTLFEENKKLDELKDRLLDFIDDRKQCMDILSRLKEGECSHCLTVVSAERLKQQKEFWGSKQANLELEIHTLNTSVKMCAQQLETNIQNFRNAQVEKLTHEFETAKTIHSISEKSLTSEIAAAQTAIDAQIKEWRINRKVTLDGAFSVSFNDNLSLQDKAGQELAAAQEEISKLELDPVAIENRTRIRNLLDCIDEESHKLDTNNESLRVSQLAQEQRDKLDDELIASGLEIQDIERRINDLEYLDRHLGDKGFKRWKLRSCLDSMNVKLAKYMGILGVSMSVWFQDRELKKASAKKNPKTLTDEDYTDRFEIMVADGLKQGVPIGLYSGGERTLISLAILGVLWETGCTFGRSGSNILMVDEPFGLLRENNRDRCIALLEYWGSLGRCVLVSDNSDAVSQISKRAATWEVTKTNSISTIQVYE